MPWCKSEILEFVGEKALLTSSSQSHPFVTLLTHKLSWYVTQWSLQYSDETFAISHITLIEDEFYISIHGDWICLSLNELCFVQKTDLLNCMCKNFLLLLWDEFQYCYGPSTLNLFFLSRSDGMTQWLLLKERKLTSCLSTISSTTLPFSWFSSWHFSISCHTSASPFSFNIFLSFNKGLVLR